MPSDPRWITVPAGTEPARCNGPHCTATIYFVRNDATGRFTPVTCDVEGGEHPSDTNDPDQLDAFDGRATVHDGRGLSHFLDCPDANRFAGQGRR